jgi:hypothetical protein
MTTPYHGRDPHILLRHVQPRLLHQGGNSKVSSSDRVPRGIRSLQSVRHNLLLHRDNLNSSLLNQSPVHSRHRGSSTPFGIQHTRRHHHRGQMPGSNPHPSRMFTSSKKEEVGCRIHQLLKTQTVQHNLV